MVIQPSSVGLDGERHLGIQIDLVERKRHGPFFLGLPGSGLRLLGRLLLSRSGLGLLICLLLLHGLLLLWLLGLLFHGLLLLLSLLPSLRDGLLSVVIVAAANQGQAARAHAGPS